MSSGYKCEGCGKTSRIAQHEPGCPVQAAHEQRARDWRPPTVLCITCTDMGAPGGCAACKREPDSDISTVHAAMILRGCFSANQVHGVAFEGGHVDTFVQTWWQLPEETRAHWQSVASLLKLAFKGRL